MSKVIIITGATNGIGEEAAKQLATQGHRLVIIARSKNKAFNVVKALSTSQGQKHSYYLADMSSLRDIIRVAQEIVTAEPRIDVLINNAGALFGSYEETVDKLERTIAINHLAYFVLTLGLKASLGKGSRIVNTSSELHRRGHFEVDNLDLRKGNHFGIAHGYENYNRSKLYNVIFTRRLAKMWAKDGITVNCLHPGVIRTGLGSGQWGIIEPIIGFLAGTLGQSSASGGQVITHLATSTELEGVTAKYYNRFKLQEPSDDAKNEEYADILWQQSFQWAEIKT